MVVRSRATGGHRERRAGRRPGSEANGASACRRGRGRARVRPGQPAGVWRRGLLPMGGDAGDRGLSRGGCLLEAAAGRGLGWGSQRVRGGRGCSPWEVMLETEACPAAGE